MKQFWVVVVVVAGVAGVAVVAVVAVVVLNFLRELPNLVSRWTGLYLHLGKVPSTKSEKEKILWYPRPLNVIKDILYGNLKVVLCYQV